MADPGDDRAVVGAFDQSYDGVGVVNPVGGGKRILGNRECGGEMRWKIWMEAARFFENPLDSWCVSDLATHESCGIEKLGEDGKSREIRLAWRVRETTLRVAK